MSMYILNHTNLDWNAMVNELCLPERVLGHLQKLVFVVTVPGIKCRNTSCTARFSINSSRKIAVHNFTCTHFTVTPPKVLAMTDMTLDETQL